MLLSRREEGYQQILLGLFQLLRAAEEAGPRAPLTNETLAVFLDPLRACLGQEGSLMLGEREGHLYLNGLRAHIDLEVFPALKYLVLAFHDRKLSGLLFESGVDEEELGRFLICFLSHESSEGEFTCEDDLDSIHPLRQEDEGDEPAGRYRIDPGTVYTSKKTWFKNILVVKHLLLGRSSSCPVDVDEAMHILQDLAQVILSEDAFLMALDDLEDWDSRLFSHSVDVALICVHLGRRMGLDQDLLNALSVAALVHDIGYVDLHPGSSPSAEKSWDADDGQHECHSFRRLAASAVSSKLLMRASLIAYRHHDEGSHLPYPGAEDEGRRSLLTAIVAVVDSYDRMLKGEDQAEIPRSPREALAVLAARFESVSPDLLQLLRESVDPL